MTSSLDRLDQSGVAFRWQQVAAEPVLFFLEPRLSTCVGCLQQTLYISVEIQVVSNIDFYSPTTLTDDEDL